MAEVEIFIYQPHVLHKTVPSPAGRLISGSDRRVEGVKQRHGGKERQRGREEGGKREGWRFEGRQGDHASTALLSGKYHLVVLQMRLQLLVFEMHLIRCVLSFCAHSVLARVCSKHLTQYKGKNNNNILFTIKKIPVGK